jgi:hypothetical protein
MGLFRRNRKKPEFQDPAKADPVEALRLAQEGLAKTGTYVDEHGRRRKIPDEMRASMEASLAAVERSIEHHPNGDGAG